MSEHILQQQAFELQKIFDAKLASDKTLTSKTFKLVQRGVAKATGNAHTQNVKVTNVRVSVGTSFQDAFPDLPKDGWGYTDRSATNAIINITVDDVNQYGLADCYFLSPLMDIADTNPNYIANNILQLELDANNVPIPGKYIVFFQGTVGNANSSIWTRVHVNAMIDGIQNHSGPDGDYWLALIEKAFAYFRTGADTFSSINWGWPTQTFQTFGLMAGGINVYDPNTNIGAVLTALQSGKCVTLCTGNAPVQGMVASHCYGFRAYDQQPNNGTIRIRNPWGSSGGTLEHFLSPIDLATFGSVQTGTITMPSPSSSSSSPIYSSSSSSSSSPSPSSSSSFSSSSSSSSNPNGEVKGLMLYTLPTATPFKAVSAIRVGGTYEVCTEGDKDLYWTSVGNCLLFTIRVTSNTNTSLVIRYYSEKGAKIGLDISGVAQPTIAAPATGAKQTWTDLTIPIPTLMVDPATGEGIHIFKLYAVSVGIGMGSIRFV